MLPRTMQPRHLFSLLLLVITTSVVSTGCQNAFAASSATRDRKTLTIWHLSNSKVEVTVDASIGRITHYGFRNGPNVLWTNDHADNPKYQFGGWWNYGGDKIWIWPQDLYGWPPPEPKDGYVVEAVDDNRALMMTSAEMPGYGIRIRRKVELANDTSTMIVTSWFEQVGNSFVKPMGTWSITQVPTPKKVFVRIPLAGDRNRYLARKADGFDARIVSPSVLQLLKPNGDDGIKTCFDADVIAAVFDGVMLLQRQMPVHVAGAWVADERAQIYGHPIKAENVPGVSYYELEWTAPVVVSNVARQAPLRVIYKLIKLDANTTEAQIADVIQQVP